LGARWRRGEGANRMGKREKSEEGGRLADDILAVVATSAVVSGGFYLFGSRVRPAVSELGEYVVRFFGGT